MYLKHLTVFSILVCGQCAWKYNNEITNSIKPDLEGYRLVTDALSYDGVNSVMGLERVYIPERNIDLPIGLVNLTQFQRVDSQRILKFDTLIKTSELLLSGEMVFQGKRKEKAIQTRAFLYGQGECKRLQKVLVSGCKIKDMKITHKPGDIIHIGYQFGFVQNFSFGDVAKDTELIYEEKRIHFYELFEDPDLSQIKQEEIRIKFYKRIEQYCEKIRWLLGTCAVDSLSFKYASKMKSSNSLDALAVDVSFTSLVGLNNSHTTENIK